MGPWGFHGMRSMAMGIGPLRVEQIAVRLTPKPSENQTKKTVVTRMAVKEKPVLLVVSDYA